MYAIACAFRWVVALVGEFFYWVLLTGPPFRYRECIRRRRSDEAVICEGGRYVALSNIFFFCKSVLYKMIFIKFF